MSSCTEEEEFIPQLQIHEDFAMIVDTFVVEAARHGILINITNLILDYDPALDDLTCGQCNDRRLEVERQKRVGINANINCWENHHELETLIFHELGHCLLGRDHVTDTLPNGDPKSLMVPGDLTVFAPCRYVFGDADDCNNTYKRAYYIAELFDPTTPVPDWAK